MPRAISLDLRQRLFDAVQSGESCTEAAERFEVSPAFVRRLVQRHRESGTLAPKTRPPRAFQLADRADEIRKLLAEHPGLTAGEVRRRLGVACYVNTVWRMIRRLGNSFKKSLRAAEQQRSMKVFYRFCQPAPWIDLDESLLPDREFQRAE